MSIKTSTSFRKGQFNLTYVDDKTDRLNFIFHANTLVPLRDTLHFGIKPGHFMLYVKRPNEGGEWVVNDAGYVNYFRADQEQIIQTEYNTIQKQKLLTRGLLRVKKVNETKYILKSYSLFPIHRRIATLDLLERTLKIDDLFLGKTSIFFNTPNGLVTDQGKFSSSRTISW